MVLAIDGNRKTETRRLGTSWQRAEKGDALYVRESHYVECAGYKDGSGKRILYRATNPGAPTMWTPSIHMPRWASRFTLVVTKVRVMRVQDIDREDAMREGFSGIAQFVELWKKINGAASWDENPEVAAISFSVSRLNIDKFLESE